MPGLRELRAHAREVIEAELAPHADAWEAAGHFPDAVFRTLAGAGLLGLAFPEELGGRALGPRAAAVLCEELVRCESGGVAAGIGAHVGIACPPLHRFGTREQHERWLVPAIAGESVAALAITEPHAGSDVAAARTHAHAVDGGFVVNGAKTYITNGVRAGFYVAAVRTTEEGGHHGMSFLVLEPGPGVHASPLSKLGWHASDTAELAFDDVAVGDDALLGELHGGFRLVMANFAWERLMLSLGAIASAELWLGRTRPLVRGQAARHRLALLEARVAAARAHADRTLDLLEAGGDATTLVTEGKLATQRLAVEVLDACVDVHFEQQTAELERAERALRDARLGPIGGGTDEIMRELRGRALAL